MGHTEELAKQNTFNNLDPYDDDVAAVFLLEVMLKDEVSRAAHKKNGSLIPTRDDVKMLFTGRPLENIGQSDLG